jgi:hypothetical protein
VPLKKTYPDSPESIGVWTILWNKLEKIATDSGRKRIQVILMCSQCGYKTTRDAHAVLAHMKIPERCQKCIKPFAKALANYHHRGEEIRLNGSRVLWHHTEVFTEPGRDSVFMTPVICRCGFKRPVAPRHLGTGAKSGLCRQCSLEERKKNGQYYESIRLSDGDPFISMARETHGNKYVSTHRYVMAQKIGRPLETWEHVHHIDGNKRNNTPDNLQLVSPDKHCSITAMQRRIRKLEAEIKRLTMLQKLEAQAAEMGDMKRQ